MKLFTWYKLFKSYGNPFLLALAKAYLKINGYDVRLNVEKRKSPSRDTVQYKLEGDNA